MDSSFCTEASDTTAGSRNNDSSVRPDDVSSISFARPPIRSCTLCRQRKIRCDRQQPCASCIRVAAKCVYPAGPGRAPKRPRKAVEARLLAQLSRLETIVRCLEPEGAGRSDRASSGQTHAERADQDRESIAPPTSSTAHSEPETDLQIGRLIIDETQSCYVSSAVWARLGDEIEELRDFLHEPDSDDEDHESVSEQPAASAALGSLGSNAAVMGFRSLAHSLRNYHPPVSQAVALFEIFKENVSRLIRIFHMPTLIQLFWDSMASLDSLDKNVEALLFAIYYSAMISLEPEECLDQLGVPRSRALETYRFAAEQAMARADLLNTQNMILLQAAVLFLSALRNEDYSRTVWSLTSLIFHIAQAMGLHRDGASFGLRPLETELRRRLWWHILFLDNRSTEYHGCEPIAQGSTYDTKAPLNINDSDLTAQMTEPPQEREGITEMTYSLMRCETIRAVRKLCHTTPGESDEDPGNGSCFEAREALAEDLQTRFQSRYVNHSDPSAPFLRVISKVAQLITLRMWVSVLYPRCSKDLSNTLLRDTRARLFRISTQILQLSSSLLTDEETHQWAWHSKTHIQWHAVAFVLAEICWRPPSPECELAWECVNKVYHHWEGRGNDKRGMLWRPIKRLMAKAQYVRDVQKSRGSTSQQHRWKVATGSVAPTPDHRSREDRPTTSELEFDHSQAGRGIPSRSGTGGGPSDFAEEPLDPCWSVFPYTTGIGGVGPPALDMFGMMSGPGPVWNFPRNLQTDPPGDLYDMNISMGGFNLPPV
ncbi:hypothetical protein P175DRAFT_0503918 [Aspergillus ochraceoroseus IBT 24754]|uniref:Zn(2)-C6 fungal-type domain-containing protein n=2 Tax=Aspergillus ochraceoroseus TaxID=138278 RepID=A0A2T5LP30_9EURO|nr:uncharacterized protein P175DRAFT_0503918 [Aspergillus ochraceoroseus IBT 24754]KKK19414.1 hypothetical protein AOCH_001333 [Aspergillus ochraceoroseus]PTU18038.1 hypothetical protein P175DRAFT_0503918 [Aspergillus ochraceoroseus IBT 24754]